MSNPTSTPTQSLAKADYELLGRLARAIDRVNKGKQRVAEAGVRDIAYHAAELTQAAQDAQTAFEMVQLTGAQARYPEIAEKALEGDSTAVTMGMGKVLMEVLGR